MPKPVTPSAASRAASTAATTVSPATSVAEPGNNPSPPSTSRRPDNFRDIVESVVVAFVLAFLFRTFEAEAFVIPTGSMAPTLHGAHRDVDCNQCGVHFEVSASEEIRGGVLNPAERTIFAVCPNCRFPNDTLRKELFRGDRILVNKFPYDLGSPDRWDVVVFKYPEEPGTNYIKRLVGLPGEELKIEWGNVYVRKLASQDPFRIPRKPPDKQRVLQQLVYDDDHPPHNLIATGWPERWAAEPGARWTGDPAKRSYLAEPEPVDDDSEHWLRYRHLVPTVADWAFAANAAPAGDKAPQPELITDFYGYNSNITAREQWRGRDELPELRASSLGLQWVGDLTISTTVEVFEARGELICELVKGDRRYRCRIDLKTGTAGLSYIDNQLNKTDQEIPLGDAATTMTRSGSYRLSFANVDDRLCLWVNDSLAKTVEFDPGSRYAPPAPPISPTDRDLAPVGFAVRGARVRLSHLLLERDVFYRYAVPGERSDDDAFGKGPEEFHRLLQHPESWFELNRERKNAKTYALNDGANDTEDEFMVLGDNSPRSSDSRLWNHSHAVARRLLIGKAFYIYWPHAVPFLNHGNGWAVMSYPGVAGEPLNDDDRRGEHRDRFPPPVPSLSIPFYPQVQRMHRIR